MLIQREIIYIDLTKILQALDLRFCIPNFVQTALIRPHCTVGTRDLSYLDVGPVDCELYRAVLACDRTGCLIYGIRSSLTLALLPGLVAVTWQFSWRFFSGSVGHGVLIWLEVCICSKYLNIISRVVCSLQTIFCYLLSFVHLLIQKSVSFCFDSRYILTLSFRATSAYLGDILECSMFVKVRKCHFP